MPNIVLVADEQIRVLGLQLVWPVLGLVPIGWLVLVPAPEPGHSGEVSSRVDYHRRPHCVEANRSKQK